MNGKHQLTKSGIACPRCWTPIVFEDMKNPAEFAADVLVFGFECEVCSCMFLASYEQMGDKVAWKSRGFV